MAILQAALAMLFKQMGRLLNTAFGWATTLLFGEVPEKRQMYLSAMALGSVLWLAVALGVIVPSVGTFLLAFVPKPSWLSDFWVRIIMLALALILPAIVGVVSLFVVDPEDRPEGFGGKSRAVLKGYPYTIGLALTIVLMVIVAPIMKVRDMAKRWTATHVPIVVKAKDYFEVLGEVQRVLRKGQFETTRERASFLLRWPTKVFTFFAGGMEDLVADELSVLRSPKIEVLLHPSDLVISGREHDVMRVHALLTEHLTFTKAYLTWTKEAHELEDRLGALWRRIKAGASQDQASSKLADFEHDLKTVKLSYDEWEVLFREKLIIERGLLRAEAGMADESEDLTDERSAKSEAVQQSERRPAERPAVTSWAGIFAFIALLWRNARRGPAKQ